MLRCLTYALAGIILGYGYPVLCMYIEFALKHTMNYIIYGIAVKFI